MVILISEGKTTWPNDTLFGGTVPPNSTLFGWTVPPNSTLFGRILDSDKPCQKRFDFSINIILGTLKEHFLKVLDVGNLIKPIHFVDRQTLLWADVEVMVDLGILVPRKFLSSQKIFREITAYLSWKWNVCNTTAILSQKWNVGNKYSFF